jgi:hypothetical protein
MSQPRQDGEFHRADPAFKRQMTRWVAVVAGGGVIALFALNRWLVAIRAAHGDDPALMQAWMQRVIAGLCLLLAAVGVAYALRLRAVAEATRRERRWPPSSMRTAEDIRVRYLTSADALVTQMKAGAAALWVLAAALTGWAAWLFWLAR